MPSAKAEIKACDALWHRGTDYDTYMAYVTCVKTMLGLSRLNTFYLINFFRGSAFFSRYGTDFATISRLGS